MPNHKSSVAQPITITPMIELFICAGAAEPFRVSRRTIEELDKAYDRGMTTFPSMADWALRSLSSVALSSRPTKEIVPGSLNRDE